MQLNQPQAGFRIPCPGISMRRTEKKWGVLRVHYSADPDLVDADGNQTEKLLALRDRISNEADWKLEMEIEWEAREGQLVYPEFSKDLHVIPDDQIPHKLVRYMSIDPHPRTPHALLWAGVDQWDDVYFYRDYWPSMMWGKSGTLKDTDKEKHAGRTVKAYAEAIADFEGNSLQHVKEHSRFERARYIQHLGGERIYQRFMDCAGKGFYANGEDESQESYERRYATYGIKCQSPNKRHRAGQDAVHSLLEPRKTDSGRWWPRMHIAKSCKELIFEFENHRFQQTRRPSEERELKQKPAEARCHQLDNCRYLAMAGIGWIRGWES